MCGLCLMALAIGMVLGAETSTLLSRPAVFVVTTLPAFSAGQLVPGRLLHSLVTCAGMDGCARVLDGGAWKWHSDLKALLFGVLGMC